MDLIKNSFIFLDRIGEAKEQSLWAQGIHNWDDFLIAEKIKGIGPKSKAIYDIMIMRAKEQYQNDPRGFLMNFPGKHMWRAFHKFRDETLYLDIETTEYYGDISMIGLGNGEDADVLVKDYNLEKHTFFDKIRDFNLLVTFNGSSFDNPIITNYFLSSISIPHIDLRHACCRAGLNADLKTVEKMVGIKRSKDLESMQGEVIHLWHMWKETGNEEYLELLIKYNRADVMNLQPIMEHVFDVLKNDMLLKIG